MNFYKNARIEKNGILYSSSDDVRVDVRNGNKTGIKWYICGFAHALDGVDYKKSSMIQSGANYGRKEGETVGITIIDKPQFSARTEWDTEAEAIAALNNPDGLPITFDLFGRDIDIDYRLYIDTKSNDN